MVLSIAVTDIVKSPITEVSDLVLLTSSAEDPPERILRSKIAQIHMLDLLYTGVALRLSEEVVELTKRQPSLLWISFIKMTRVFLRKTRFHIP